MIGVDGIATGAATTEAGELVQDPEVNVTVYVPAVETIIVEDVSPVDHKIEPAPETVNIEFPQLLVTVVTGAEPPAVGFAATVEGALVQPPTV
jgi:hypothetical protein